ncbi:MAG: thioredoxin [Candidatus Saganbacteria bacterium]|nr:thioredoxin [Candidatus Saganbacteria bacterium]
MSDLPSVTGENFQSEVLQGQKPVLVDFWAPWCVPCKMIGPVLEKAAAKLGDRLRVVKLNVEEEKATADSHGVMSIPSLVMFAGGKEVGRIAGFMDEARLSAEIADLLEMAG